MEAAPAFILGGIQAGMAASAAKKTNKALARSARSATAAAEVETGQIGQAAAMEQQKAIAEAERVRGRLRVIRAGSGFGVGGTYAALERQLDMDLEHNQQVVRTNAAHQTARVRSGLEARLSDLSANRVNPLISAITAGIQGIGTGLSISRGVKDAFKP